METEGKQRGNREGGREGGRDGGFVCARTNAGSYARKRVNSCVHARACACCEPCLRAQPRARSRAFVCARSCARTTRTEPDSSCLKSLSRLSCRADSGSDHAPLAFRASFAELNASQSARSLTRAIGGLGPASACMRVGEVDQLCVRARVRVHMRASVSVRACMGLRARLSRGEPSRCLRARSRSR